MTRTDVMASSRPRTVGATSTLRRSRRGRRRLSAVPITLVMAAALVLPSAALAAEGTSGYGSTPTTPTTTTTPKTTPTTPATTPTTPTTPTTTPTTPEPKTGTSPSKEKSSPETKSTAPSAEKATTLPFTGLDLRWVIVVGVLLMGAGFSIVLVQRRHRRDGGS
jgi:uncharacterized membrane protein